MTERYSTKNVPKIRVLAIILRFLILDPDIQKSVRETINLFLHTQTQTHLTQTHTHTHTHIRAFVNTHTHTYIYIYIYSLHQFPLAIDLWPIHGTNLVKMMSRSPIQFPTLGEEQWYTTCLQLPLLYRHLQHHNDTIIKTDAGRLL